MSILEEEKLNELKTRFAELDFKDSEYPRKIEEIINEVLVENTDKIGTITETKTIDEALQDEKEGFEELKGLQEEGIFEKLEDERLKEALKEQAEKGIQDEAAERKSLEDAGFLAKASTEVTVENILEEILQKLEEVIKEKKKDIDKKIQANEAMRKKVQKREELRGYRQKVNNLHEKTKNYKGNEGKRLNQNVESAIQDFDRQLQRLEAETKRDDIEITENILDEENKKYEEEKKTLDNLLQKLKKDYKEENAKKAKMFLIEKQINDIANGFTSNMNPNDFQDKANALFDLYDRNKDSYAAEIGEMFKNKEIIVETKNANELVSFNLGRIINARQMGQLRENYLTLTGKDETTDEEKEQIQKCEDKYEKYKEVLEAICGKRIKVLPLQTASQYADEFEEMKRQVEKIEGNVFGFRAKNKLNGIVNKIKNIYMTIAKPISKQSDPNAQKARDNYKNLIETLRANEKVEIGDLSNTLPGGEIKKNPIVPPVKTPTPSSAGTIEEELQNGMEEIADGVKEEI